ncbi:FAD:protein FMN transferase [Deinococcus irradiatisoli]|uniref:FAD:protein FMN transferase n=1 Tax=Deinococcus irradiatisoli TaxID=2202254 RepID=A0A2Z3JIR0_9DEIO|nr:FAD:protein FMN transferase [Deinococcus irradiatisoli]AWN23491.1 FAD:protein FMN transferase [Deinococcus irradiatisoli]
MKFPLPKRPPQHRLSRIEGVLGTAMELQVVAGNRAQLDAAEAAVMAELDRLEQVFSRFRPDSELNRLLAQARPGTPVRVSADFAALLSQAEHFMTVTGGAFHPAADTLARLWAAGEPGPAELQGVLEKLRSPLWTLEGQPVTLHTDLTLNFNAHAKGFITDRAAQAASASPGVREVLLNIGGDVRHLGPRPVQVGVEAPGPLADNRPPLLHVTVHNQAVATSGHAHRGAHLFDPRSGRPTSAERAVSVLAGSCAEADALSTAFCVLDPAESLQVADRLPGVGVLILEGPHRYSNHFWQQHQTQH